MDIRQKIERDEKQLLKLQKRLQVLKGRQTIKCNACGHENELNSLTLEVEYYYVEPYGCSGGDYWTDGDAPAYNITCPICLTKKRYTEDTGYPPKPAGMNLFIWENQQYFKEKVKVHK